MGGSTDIVIQGFLDLCSAWVPGRVLQLEHDVTVRASEALAARSVYPTLDWGFLAGAVRLCNGCTLTFLGLELKQWGAEPSLLAAFVAHSPGARVVLEDCVLHAVVGLPAPDALTLLSSAPRAAGLPSSGLGQALRLQAAPPAPASTTPVFHAFMGWTTGASAFCFNSTARLNACTANSALLLDDWSAVAPVVENPITGIPGAPKVTAGGFFQMVTGSVVISDYTVPAACYKAHSASECVAQKTRELFKTAVSPPSSKSSGHSQQLTLGLAVGLTVGGSLLLAAAMFVLLRRYRRGSHRTLLGFIAPPGASPDTTLLITDIQNSTRLWEDLPVLAMDRALRLHHAAIRQLLPKHSGYESATEGDSFTLAFHSAADAARFSLACQMELLDLPWPKELLAHPDGSELLLLPAAVQRHDSKSIPFKDEHSQLLPPALAIAATETPAPSQQALGRGSPSTGAMLVPAIEERRNDGGAAAAAGPASGGGGAHSGFRFVTIPAAQALPVSSEPLMRILGVGLARPPQAGMPGPDNATSAAAPAANASSQSPAEGFECSINGNDIGMVLTPLPIGQEGSAHGGGRSGFGEPHDRRQRQRQQARDGHSTTSSIPQLAMNASAHGGAAAYGRSMSGVATQGGMGRQADAEGSLRRAVKAPVVPPRHRRSSIAGLASIWQLLRRATGNVSMDGTPAVEDAQQQPVPEEQQQAQLQQPQPPRRERNYQRMSLGTPEDDDEERTSGLSRGLHLTPSVAAAAAHGSMPGSSVGGGSNLPLNYFPTSEFDALSTQLVSGPGTTLMDTNVALRVSGGAFELSGLHTSTGTGSRVRTSRSTQGRGSTASQAADAACTVDSGALEQAMMRLHSFNTGSSASLMQQQFMQSQAMVNAGTSPFAIKVRKPPGRHMSLGSMIHRYGSTGSPPYATSLHLSGHLANASPHRHTMAVASASTLDMVPTLPAMGSSGMGLLYGSVYGASQSMYELPGSQMGGPNTSSSGTYPMGPAPLSGASTSPMARPPPAEALGPLSGGGWHRSAPQQQLAIVPQAWPLSGNNSSQGAPRALTVEEAGLGRAAAPTTREEPAAAAGPSRGPPGVQLQYQQALPVMPQIKEGGGFETGSGDGGSSGAPDEESTAAAAAAAAAADAGARPQSHAHLRVNTAKPYPRHAMDMLGPAVEKAMSNRVSTTTLSLPPHGSSAALAHVLDTEGADCLAGDADVPPEPLKEMVTALAAAAAPKLLAGTFARALFCRSSPRAISPLAPGDTGASGPEAYGRQLAEALLAEWPTLPLSKRKAFIHAAVSALGSAPSLAAAGAEPAVVCASQQGARPAEGSPPNSSGGGGGGGGGGGSSATRLLVGSSRRNSGRGSGLYRHALLQAASSGSNSLSVGGNAMPPDSAATESQPEGQPDGSQLQQDLLSHVPSAQPASSMPTAARSSGEAEVPEEMGASSASPPLLSLPNDNSSGCPPRQRQALAAGDGASSAAAPAQDVQTYGKARASAETGGPTALSDAQMKPTESQDAVNEADKQPLVTSAPAQVSAMALIAALATAADEGGAPSIGGAVADCASSGVSMRNFMPSDVAPATPPEDASAGPATDETTQDGAIGGAATAHSEECEAPVPAPSDAMLPLPPLPAVDTGAMAAPDAATVSADAVAGADGDPSPASIKEAPRAAIGGAALLGQAEIEAAGDAAAGVAPPDGDKHRGLAVNQQGQQPTSHPQYSSRHALSRLKKATASKRNEVVVESLDAAAVPGSPSKDNADTTSSAAATAAAVAALQVAGGLVWMPGSINRWSDYCRSRWSKWAPPDISRSSTTHMVITHMGTSKELASESISVSTWPQQQPPPGAVVALRGLRVRMGLHSLGHLAEEKEGKHRGGSRGGATNHICSHNPTTGRMAYGGAAIKAAKAIGDAAAGGMVLITDTTFERLLPVLPELLTPSAGGPARVLYCGDSKDVGGASHSLYQLLTPAMVPRVGYLPALRGLDLCQLGNVDAPVGCVVIGFMHVSNTAPLLAELGVLAQEALETAKDIITTAATRCGGYVAEATEALVLAAFGCPASALAWALSARHELLNHAWAPALLESQWFEEVKEYVPTLDGNDDVMGTTSGMALQAGSLSMAGGGRASTSRATNALMNMHMHSHVSNLSGSFVRAQESGSARPSLPRTSAQAVSGDAVAAPARPSLPATPRATDGQSSLFPNVTDLLVDHEPTRGHTSEARDEVMMMSTTAFAALAAGHHEHAASGMAAASVPGVSNTVGSNANATSDPNQHLMSTSLLMQLMQVNMTDFSATAGNGEHGDGREDAAAAGEEENDGGAGQHRGGDRVSPRHGSTLHAVSETTPFSVPPMHAVGSTANNAGLDTMSGNQALVVIPMHYLSSSATTHSTSNINSSMHASHAQHSSHPSHPSTGPSTLPSMHNSSVGGHRRNDDARSASRGGHAGSSAGDRDLARGADGGKGASTPSDGRPESQVRELPSFASTDVVAPLMERPGRNTLGAGYQHQQSKLSALGCSQQGGSRGQQMHLSGHQAQQQQAQQQQHVSRSRGHFSSPALDDDGGLMNDPYELLIRTLQHVDHWARDDDRAIQSQHQTLHATRGDSTAGAGAAPPRPIVSGGTASAITVAMSVAAAETRSNSGSRGAGGQNSGHANSVTTGGQNRAGSGTGTFGSSLTAHTYNRTHTPASLRSGPQLRSQRVSMLQAALASRAGVRNSNACNLQGVGSARERAGNVEITVLRGPRIKCGLALGAVSADVSEATGRLGFRGKVMNRAARTSLKATDGQVLCSSEVWAAAQVVLAQQQQQQQQQDAPPAAGTAGAIVPPGVQGFPSDKRLVGSYCGSIGLKGIADPVDLYEVNWECEDAAKTT